MVDERRESRFRNRVQELDDLAKWISDGSHVLVIGIPGVGKSRLLKEFFKKRGGEKHFLSDNLSTYLVDDLFYTATSHEFFGSLLSSISPEAGKIESDLPFHALRRRLLAVDSPVVFLLDDFWKALVYLEVADLRRLFSLPSARLVGVVRPGTVDNLDEEIRGWILDGFDKNLWVRPLNPVDIKKIAKDQLSTDQEQNGIERIAKYAGGHPHLAEMLASLSDTPATQHAAYEEIQRQDNILEAILEELDPESQAALKFYTQHGWLPDREIKWLHKNGLFVGNQLFSPLFQELLWAKTPGGKPFLRDLKSKTASWLLRLPQQVSSILRLAFHSPAWKIAFSIIMVISSFINWSKPLGIGWAINTAQVSTLVWLLPAVVALHFLLSGIMSLWMFYLLTKKPVWRWMSLAICFLILTVWVVLVRKGLGLIFLLGTLTIVSFLAFVRLELNEASHSNSSEGGN